MKKRYLALSFLLVVFAAFFMLAQGPDQELHFKRVVPSQLDPSRLSRNISSTTRWPRWFHAVDKVEVMGSGVSLAHQESAEPANFQKGSTLKLEKNRHARPQSL